MKLGQLVGIAQLFVLLLWEALGVVAFGWSPLAIGAVWVVGILTFNTAIASAVNTYTTLMTPPAQVVNNVIEDKAVVIDQEDTING